MESLQGRKSGLPRLVDEDTEILILGTLPSDMSLAAGQYYANPGNDFWKLVGAALDKSLDGLSYEDKLELLKGNRIGLWDAFHTCFRPGSMDGDITETELNDFQSLKSVAPSIRLICFNGKTAAKAEKSLVRLEYQTRLLPSSSGANRKDQNGRLVSWKAAIQFLMGYFNKKYRLTPEPILSDADVLSTDGLSSLFVRVDTGRVPSLNDIQTVLAEILLIPQVLESVRTTFRIAKRLYLFGRFEYGLYSVSEHYTFLAIEAAIVCRWTASLPNPVTLHFNGITQQMSTPTHGELAELWMNTGRSLTVDNLKFPNSPISILKRLREACIIDAVTEERLSAVIGLRNDLSHHESSTVIPPSWSTLHMAAELIEYFCLTAFPTRVPTSRYQERMFQNDRDSEVGDAAIEQSD